MATMSAQNSGYPPLPNQEILQLALFVDHGGVSIKDPPPGIKKSQQLTGAGYGFRLNLPYNINGRFDVGFPVKPAKASNGNRPVSLYPGSSEILTLCAFNSD